MKSVFTILTLVAAVAAKHGQKDLYFANGVCTAQLLYCGSVLIDDKGNLPAFKILREFRGLTFQLIGYDPSELRHIVPDHKGDVRNWLFKCKDYNNHLIAVEYCHVGCKDNGTDENDECYPCKSYSNSC
jgi:hypothetical protein